ncbi:unnamed protein product, partial [Mesorhabditis belari]|uniref:Ethylmalonyl-CoA decarboxylase n=1 Tax=Mesorhabditis belari TaxID=2138241 RepID=A0AAF3EVL2_9BILA
MFLKRISNSFRQFSTNKLKPANFTPQRAAEYLSTFEGGKVTIELYGKEFPGIATLTLDNPTKKNGLTGSMMADLHYSMDRLEKDEQNLRALIIQGSNGTFCSGGDLDFVKKICDSDHGYIMCSLMSHTLTRLSRLPFISISKIEGFALGGGAELASTCDIRVAHAKAKIGFVQGRIGVTPGWGGLPFIVRNFGYSRALEALCTAKVFNSLELQKLGFLQEIYETNADFEKYLSRYLSIEVEPIKAMKKGVIALQKRDLEAFEVERRVFASLWGGELQKALLSENRKHK